MTHPSLLDPEDALFACVSRTLDLAPHVVRQSLRGVGPSMSRPSIIHLDREVVVAARIERMLDLAEFVGIDPEALAFLAHRLAAEGREREGMGPSPRRDELDRLIVGDLEVLCRAYKRMARVVERMARA